ncbi:uridine monophosphate kinase [Streptomyces sp. NPDC001406]|uniref:uridine monophosphate kinase n=1 Tax=Streptomyces sp. NPDC001406 TaxID=3364572 RepID=UPI0036C985B9
MVKLSGAAFAGTAAAGTDPVCLGRMADEVASVHDPGVQIAVCRWRGNYFRGTPASSWGIGRAEADEIGMLGTVMNALMLRAALTTRGEPDVRVMTAVAMQSVAEPFIRLCADRHLRRGRIVLLAGGTGQPCVIADYAAVQRSLELSADALLVAKRGVDGVYDSDAKTHPDAKRYAHLTYQKGDRAKGECDGHLRFPPAEEQNLVMHVFDVAAAGTTPAICEGRDIGTRITAA